MSTTSRSSRAHAFNEGSDARICGTILALNPYDRSAQFEQHEAWDAGWQYVHRFWGLDVHRRWQILKLPHAWPRKQGRP